MLADCLHIKDGSHIYDRSCQRPEVGEGGGGLDDKSKPGIWFLNQFKTDAMATFSFLTDSYLHLGRLAYFFPFKSCNWVTRIIRLLFRTRGINIKPILINSQTFFPRSWN